MNTIGGFRLHGLSAATVVTAASSLSSRLLFAVGEAATKDSRVFAWPWHGSMTINMPHRGTSTVQ